MIKKTLPWLAAIALYICFCLTGRLYEDTDNYNVAVVVNGLLGNNNFCPYLHPLLCLICAGLKLILPGADVFTLTAHILLIAALGWMFKLLWERFDSLQGRIAVAAGGAYLCFGMALWNANYTVWAAFFSFAGCLGIFLAKEGKEGRIRRIVGAILYGFGLMFRWQAAFLFLPFIGMAVLTNLVEEHFKKERIKAELLRILPWLLVFTGLTVSRSVFYSFEPWKSDLAYDQARVTMSDFPVLDWDELKDLPEEVDRYTYYGAVRWMYADTEKLSLERLEDMAGPGNILKYSADLPGFLKCLKKMAVFSFEKAESCLIPLFILLIICIAEGILGLRLRRIEFILALSGSFLILFYFTMRGRILIRVWLPVILALFVLVFSIPKREPKKAEKRKHFLPVILTIVLLFICIRIQTVMTHGTSAVFAADSQADDDQFSEAYEKDQVWLVGGWIKYEQNDRVVSEYGYGWHRLEGIFMEQGKLPTKRFLRHFIPVSSFWYGQTYYKSLLTEIGIENPVEELTVNDRMRLWERSEDPYFREFFYVYLYHRFGDMDVIRERTVEGYPLFRFERKEKEVQ